MVRYESLNNLFYNQDYKELIAVETNLGCVKLKYDLKKGYYNFVGGEESAVNEMISVEPSLEVENTSSKTSKREEECISQFNRQYDRKGNYKNGSYSLTGLVTKKYTFTSKHLTYQSGQDFSLSYPYGENLIDILQTNKDFRQEIASFFKDYKLELVLDPVNNILEIQKRVDWLSIKTPYSLIADTLQRIIFHLAAIASNKDSIILFEEPENHSFPPYIRYLAQSIVESESNQFFLTTHSPYILNTLLQDTPLEELAIFITDYVDHQTVVKKLSQDKMKEMMDYGSEIFFNLNRLIND